MCPFIETAIAVANAVKIVSEVATVANGVYGVTEALSEGDLVAVVSNTAAAVAGSRIPLSGTIVKASSEAVVTANHVFKVGTALSEGDLVEVVDGVAKIASEVKLPDASGDIKYIMKLPDASGNPGYSMKLPDPLTLKPPEPNTVKAIDHTEGKRRIESSDKISDNQEPPPEQSSESSDMDEAQETNEPGVMSVPEWMQNSLEENDRPSPRESELKALEIYGGEEQKSYKDGQEVPYGTLGSTRPDIVREVGSKLEAIEVKNYDLRNNERIEALTKELQRQIGQRTIDMPEGTLQRVVLDIRGQNLMSAEIEDVINKIKQATADIYPNLPVDTIQD